MRIIKNVIKLGVITAASFSYLWTTSASLADSMRAVTAVKELQTLTAFEEEYRDLQDLAQRYGCTTQFDSAGDLPITRYEFAVGINSCWQELENSSNLQDLAVWSDLKTEFATELSELSQLNNRVARLKKQQFSTTTKLQGQILFFIADSFSENDNSEAFTGYRTRLDFNTSFTGQDVLKLRLESRNVGRLDDVSDTSLSRLSVDGSSEDRVELGELSYTFAPGDSTTVTLGTTGVGLNDLAEVLNPFSSSSKGAVSRFGRRNPATLRGSGGAGIGVKQELNGAIGINLGYSIDSDRVSEPEDGGGLFDSSASAIAQLTLTPQEELALALTYTHTYQRGDDLNLMGSTGLEDSNEPFGDNATTANNLGLQANWQVNSSLEIGGWLGYTSAQQQENGNDSATILNGALTFIFPDLLMENSEGGIIIGVPPTISGHDDSSLIAESTPLHIEALYRLELSDRLQITPGAFAVFNTDGDDSDTIWVGTVRTLFSF